MSAFSGILAETLQSAGFYSGIALCSLGIIWTLWHVANDKREVRGKRRITLEPDHIIAAGLFIALAGVCWQIFQPVSRASQLSEIEAKLSEIGSAYDKYVKPRELSQDQIDAMEAFLLPRPSHKIKVIFPDRNREANHYAAQFYRTFKKAHWECELLSDEAPKFIEGLRYNVKYPDTRKGDANVADDLKRAFEAAGMAIGGGSSGSSETGELYVELLVGPRPTR